MATPERGGFAGLSIGGIIVIAGILAMIFWSVWIGVIITLIGLIAFGGFARGKWY
jgi:tetrahydromethanopterin S-methyltransferase subunit B